MDILFKERCFKMKFPFKMEERRVFLTSVLTGPLFILL